MLTQYHIHVSLGFFLAESILITFLRPLRKTLGADVFLNLSRSSFPIKTRNTYLKYITGLMKYIDFTCTIVLIVISKMTNS